MTWPDAPDTVRSRGNTPFEIPAMFDSPLAFDTVRLRRRARAALCVLVAALTLGACSTKEKRAGLVLAFQTDVSVPDDVDKITIEISSYGDVVFSRDYPVGKDGVRLPATLTIVPPQQRARPVTIRVISWKDDNSLTLRRVVTTVPTEREALLRMPIEWLCYRQSKLEDEQVVSTCEEKDTSCLTGECVPDLVDSSTLPSFAADSVFGSPTADGRGACFDTSPCFAAHVDTSELGLDLDSCSLDLAEAGDLGAGGAGTGEISPEQLNFAFVPTSSTGICGDWGCFIPLDRDETSGWRVEGSRVVLPPAVCARLQQDDDTRLVATTACATKNTQNPTCGPWSAVTGTPLTVVDLDALPPPLGSGTGGSGGTSSSGGTDGNGGTEGNGTGATSGNGGTGGSSGGSGTGAASGTGGSGTGGGGTDGTGGSSTGGTGAASGMAGSGNGSGVCGDGVVNGPEEACDDGNDVTGDGCHECQRVVSVEAHTYRACALISDGRLKCWGRNEFGQLGLGDTNSRGAWAGDMESLVGIDFGPGRRVARFALGSIHACVLFDDNVLKCWGNNGAGQLGLGDGETRGDDPDELNENLDPVDLGNYDVESLALGDAHSCALLVGGQVKCWGDNSRGQLGLGDLDSRGDEPGEMGEALPLVDLGTGRTALALNAGNNHTCALLDNRTVKCWGDNSFGQLGQGDLDPRGSGPNEMGDALLPVALGTGRYPVAIDVGMSHSCALLDNDTIKCWGYNSSGQLGSGQVGHSGDAPGQMGDALPAVDLGPGLTARALSAGALHTCALLSSGAVKCWGSNGSGECGTGDTITRGDSDSTLGSFLPTTLLERSVLSVSAGAESTCALLDDSRVKCWGGNAFGQLGLGQIGNRGADPSGMGANLPSLLLP